MLSSLHSDDIRILQLLQHDARITHKEIADKLGKTITPVYERVKKLEAEGYIDRYVALLNKEKLGKALTAFTHVQLKEHSQPVLKAVEKELVKIPEVMECYHMTGQYDFLLKVAISDMKEYHDFMLNKLATIANIGTVQSFFVLSESKQETAFALQMPSKRRAK